MPKKGRDEPLIDAAYKLSEKKGEFLLFRNAGTLGQDARCEFPEMTPTYIDNLCRLGLTEIPAGMYLVDDWRYHRLRESKSVTDAMAAVPSRSETIVHRKYIGITDLGDGFRKACM